MELFLQGRGESTAQTQQGHIFWRGDKGSWMTDGLEGFIEVSGGGKTSI